MTNMSNFELKKFQLGNMAIIASAGTGKTYNICGIVEKLVKDDKIDLKKILIVTYTEKAAEELKDRIRKQLPGADVDGATIGTIHSFCQQAIEEYSIASGKPSKLALIDESDVTDFVKQYIRKDEITKEIINIKRFIQGLDEKERKLEIEEEIIKKFCSVVNAYYLDKSNNEVNEIVSFAQLLDSNILSIYNGMIKGNYSTPITSDTIKAVIKKLEDSENSNLKKIAEEIRDKGDISFNIPRSIYTNRPAYKALPTDEKHAFELLKKAKDVFKKRGQILKVFVYVHAKELYEKWQEEKTKLSVQTYNDIIRNVREEVVSGGPLLNVLKDKYKVAIIDEFQDTNQKQWDIFSKIFLDDKHNIIVVLDPKQSIYSFQGSDTAVCKRAIQDIEDKSGIVYSLNTNYRASKGIVESTGNFFNNANALAKGMGFEPSSCGKEHFGFKYEGKSEMPAYWIWNGTQEAEAENEKGNTVKNDQKQLSEQDIFAKVVCQTIIDCCTKDDNINTRLKVVRDSDDNHKKPYEDNVSFKDFTILTRARTEMPAIRRALEKSGIPYMQYKDASVFDGLECANWITILDAVNTPDFSGRNRAKFRKALYTEFFGYTLKEINSSEFDKDNISEILLFDKWRELVRDGKWEDLIDGIIIDTGLENKLNSLKDIKTLGIFKQVGEYCIDYLAKSQSIDALIINLKKFQKNINDEEVGDSGSNITAITTDFDCVKIMTIHASKGLEFPVVISFGGFKGHVNNVDIYNYHNDGNRILSFDKPVDIFEQERTEEWQRLFYVAYTRAKYVLILPNYKKVGEDFINESIKDYINPSKEFLYRDLSDNGNDFDTLKGEVEKILSSNTSPSNNNNSKEDQEKTLKDIILNKNVHSSYKHAYSSLSHQAAKTESITNDKLSVNEAEDKKEESLAKYDKNGIQIGCEYNAKKDPIKLPDDFPAGAGLGNAIHEVFELIDYTNAGENVWNNSLINNSFAKEGFGKTCKWNDEVYEIVKNVVEAKFPEIHGKDKTGEHFSLTKLDFANRKNEVEFNFNKENEQLKNYFNGFIDLVFKRGEYYSILDWKSDRLNEEFSSYSDGKILKAHIDELYSIQRVLYSYCLIKWLKNFYTNLDYEEIFNQHFGGVYYVCVRGCNTGTGNGIYAHTWNSYEELKAAYEEIVKERIGA